MLSLRVLYIFTSLERVLYIFTSLGLLDVTASVRNVLNSQLFLRQRVCPGEIVAISNCVLVTASVGPLECAILCQRLDVCEGFLVDLNQKDCRLCSTRADDSCNNTQTAGSFLAFEKHQRCQNGAREISENTCECLPGYSGDRCQRLMTDCAEWSEVGSANGVYWIRPSSLSQAVLVRCDMAWKRTYLAFRAQRQLDFYRGWDEYANGFGDPINDHWIGLKHWSALTASSCFDLYVEFSLTTSEYYQQYYTSFVVNDQTHNFTFSFNSTSFYDRELGDCLTSVKGKPFSTHDGDNDDDVNGNCAERHHSGWWMSNCTMCNPTGNLSQPADDMREGLDSEVFWDGQIGSKTPHTVSFWLQRC